MSRARTHRGRAKTHAGKRAASVAPTERVDKQRAESVGDDQFVEITELPVVPSLEVAVLDAEAPLASATSAIASAGHTAVRTGSGADGIAALREVLPDVDAIIVALPGGEPLVDAALALEPRRPIVIAACSGGAADAIGRALAAGADLCTTRPYTVDRIAPVLLAAARLHAERAAATSARGSEAVLRARLDQLAHVEPSGLQPFELFQRVLELELKRAKRYEYALAVALFAVEIAPPPPPPGVRGILRARAGNALVHSIRDIDLATELDHERYLVLLPYTDLTGAAEVARRVITAVADLPPVVAAGRTFPARVVGAVAGATPGQPLSFSRLMRDASRALEQARRDGAELAVHQ